MCCEGAQKTLRWPVAIKVLPPEIEDGDMQFAERFKHEAQSMARLIHPNTVAVFDAGVAEIGRADGQPSAAEGPQYGVAAYSDSTFSRMK